MATGRHDDGEALLERLDQLEHDLGKYLRLPLGLLPRDASDAELREALADALLATRRGAAGTTSAAELWRAFAAEHGDALGESAAYASLEQAVARALGWQRALEDSAPLPRAAVERDLGAVAQAIRALSEEIEG